MVQPKNGKRSILDTFNHKAKVRTFLLEIWVPKITQTRMTPGLAPVIPQLQKVLGSVSNYLEHVKAYPDAAKKPSLFMDGLMDARATWHPRAH